MNQVIVTILLTFVSTVVFANKIFTYDANVQQPNDLITNWESTGLNDPVNVYNDRGVCIEIDVSVNKNEGTTPLSGIRISGRSTFDVAPGDNVIIQTNRMTTWVALGDKAMGTVSVHGLPGSYCP